MTLRDRLFWEEQARQMRKPHEKPLAAPGLNSYRCRGRFGWIMIGARDHDEAMREARRSYEGASRADLEVWNGRGYVRVDA